jgi:hypothetical protein
LADTGAVGETRGTSTFATCTEHATSAFSAAGSAITGVAGSIDARAGASGLSGGAVEYTFAVGAKLTRCTLCAAGSAVIEVVGQVLADT